MAASQRQSDVALWPIALIATVIFSVYATTAAPTIVGGDAGELVAEGCGLGSAHPPGYPLYTIIVHFVTMWLPDFAGYKAASRVNLLCSLFGGLAAAILADCVASCVLHIETPFSSIKKDNHLRILKYSFAWVCGSCAAGLWAFSPLVWQYAVTAEVFSLNNLLVSVVVRQAIKFAISGYNLFDASVGAFLVGLSLTNQHTAVLFAFPIALWVLLCMSTKFSAPSATFRDLIILGLSGLIGLSPYAYLPIASRLAPHPGSWGYVEDFSGFWHHFVRADYGSIRLYSGGSGNEGPVDRTKLWMKDYLERQSPQTPTITSPILGLVIIGIICLLLSPMWVEVTNTKQANKSTYATENERKKNKTSKSKQKIHSSPASVEKSNLNERVSFTDSLGPLLVFTLLFYIVVFHYLSNMPLDNPLLFGIHARFWQQPNWMMSLFSGVGLYYLSFSCLAVLHSIQKFVGISTPAALSWAVLGLTLLVASFLVLYQIWGNLELNDQSSNRFFEGYAHSVLRGIPDHSLVLINYDQQWTSSRYFQVCEGIAPTVTIINLSMMSFSWWQHKRALYPHMRWPGTHYTGEGSEEHLMKGGFTFEQLVASNLDIFSGGIYLGGSLSFKHESWTNRYEMIPFGMLNRVVPLPQLSHSPAVRPLERWEQATSRTWEVIFGALPTLPMLPGHDAKYSEETWEWTIGREFLDHLGDHGAYLLEQTLEDPTHEDFSSRLLTACAWFELQVNLDPQLKTSTLKNLGLGYMHLVKSSQGIPSDIPPQVASILGWAASYDTAYQSAILRHPNSRHRNVSLNLAVHRESFSEWKSWCSDRFIWSWGEFLNRPDAVKDNSYATIISIYEAVSKVAVQSNNIIEPAGSSIKKKTLKKRRKKTQT